LLEARSVKVLRDVTGALAAVALAVGVISYGMMLSQMPDKRAMDYGPQAVEAAVDRWSLILYGSWIAAVLLGLLSALFFLIVRHRETPEYLAWLAQWEAGAEQRRLQQDRRGAEQAKKRSERALYAARKAAAKHLWAYFKKNERLLSGRVPRFQARAFINSEIWGADSPEAAWGVCEEKIAELQEIVSDARASHAKDDLERKKTESRIRLLEDEIDQAEQRIARIQASASPDAMVRSRIQQEQEKIRRLRLKIETLRRE
jgi:hypothetical protein